MARISRKMSGSTLPLPLKVDKVYSVGLYARLSVEDIRKKESESIENQKYMLRKYIDGNPHLKLYSVYTDNGHTGTNFERPEFQRLMSDVKLGKVSCIVVKDLSRFGRNYIEAGNYIEKIFPFLGVRFISINDGYDSESPDRNDEALMMSLKNLINDVYSKDISRKIISQFEIKQKKGEFIGTFAPYGYLKSEQDGHKLVLDPETAPVVRNIFMWILEGMSDLKIVLRLNELEIPAPGKYRYDKGILKNKKYGDIRFWHKSAIKRITSNTAYIGHMVQGKQKTSLFDGVSRIQVDANNWIVVENTHEAIIDEETFVSVQRIKESREKDYKSLLGKYTHIGETENIMKGLVVCGDCTRNMMRHKAIGAGEKLAYSLLCPTYESSSRKACTKKSIHEEDLFSVVFTTISKQIDLASNIESVIEKLNGTAGFKASIDEVESEIGSIKKKLSRLTMLRSSLYEDFKGSLLTEGEYVFAKKKYDDQSKELQLKLGGMTAGRAIHTETLTTENKWLKALRKFKSEKQLSRDMVMELIEKVEIYSNNNVVITFKYRDEYERLQTYILQNMEEVGV